MDSNPLSRVCRVAAAVIELDALSDTVGACGEDHHAGLVGNRMLVSSTRDVGEIVIGGTRLELPGACIDGLHRRPHAENAAHGPHHIVGRPCEVRDLDIGDAHLLGREHVLGVEP